MLKLEFIDRFLSLTMTAIDSMKMNSGRIINHENSGTEGAGGTVGVGVGERGVGLVVGEGVCV